MSNVMKIAPCMKHQEITISPVSFNRKSLLQVKLDSFCCNFSMQLNKVYLVGEKNVVKGCKAVSSYSEEGSSSSSSSSSLSSVDNLPVSIELQPITSETQFDRVIAEAQQLEQSVVIVWMASWCRKCIYLKPKLEKLAADYYPSIRFYCVDVNKVPHKLVVRAEVTKMPTIQLWKDGKKQDEVIGGHKAYLVVNEVCEMIDNEDSL